jgi:predicted transcriptional regulator
LLKTRLNCSCRQPSGVEPAYKATKRELSAIRKGEADIERGEYVTLTDLLRDLDPHRRKGAAKAARKIPR